MGAPKKYTKETLEAAVLEYFASITREVVIQERVPTGEKDSWGHDVYEWRDVENNLGQIAKRTEYLVPPTLGGLCIHLGIANSTWTRWRDPAKYKSFKKIIEYVDDRMIAWRKEQVLIRKDVKGLIWDLEVNHGCGQKNQNADKDVTVTIEGGDPAWRS